MTLEERICALEAEVIALRTIIARLTPTSSGAPPQCRVAEVGCSSIGFGAPISAPISKRIDKKHRSSNGA